MNLTTTYLGFSLRSPLVVSASPLSASIDNIKQMADMGASAVVLFSFFEEQVQAEQQKLNAHTFQPLATPAEIQGLFGASHRFRADLDGYLSHIRKAKESVSIPIIASLNCTSPGTWMDFAQRIEEAGADALELNIFSIPTDIDATAAQIEDRYIRLVKMVKGKVNIPVAVKLSPFFTNLAHFARNLDQAGAGALVLFNRFYEPDLDPRTLQIQPSVVLSTSQDLRLPMHWIALLHKRIRADLAATGGIHTAEDVVKLLMVGAKVTMLASVLFQNGISYLRILEQNLVAWMEQNNYESVSALHGLVSRFNSRNPSAFERAQYIRAIGSLPSINSNSQEESASGG